MKIKTVYDLRKVDKSEYMTNKPDTSLTISDRNMSSVKGSSHAVGMVIS